MGSVKVRQTSVRLDFKLFLRASRIVRTLGVPMSRLIEDGLVSVLPRYERAAAEYQAAKKENQG